MTTEVVVGKDEAREVVEELVKDLRKHEESARELLRKVPVDADDTNVRSHVRLRAKADTYSHAAKLVEDGGLRLPEPLDEWGIFFSLLRNVAVHLSHDYEVEHARFSAVGSDDLYIWPAEGHSTEPMRVSLASVRELGPNKAIGESVRKWKQTAR